MCESPQSDLLWGWRGAASGIIQRMKHLLDTKEQSDIMFAVGLQYGGEQTFDAHKFVLSLGSDVFDRMFHGGLPETVKKIDLPEILPQAFDVMLKYLYTDNVDDLSVDNALPTLYCAKNYGIPKLIDICTDYATRMVDKNSCLIMLEEAEVLDVQTLVSKCLEIVDTHCSELMQSQGFLQLKNNTLRMIFVRDTIIANEEEIYKAAERWATNACRSHQSEATPANCRRMLGEVLFLIRFPLMDDGQLSNGPVATGLLLNEELLKIYQFKHAANKPDIPFSGTPRSSDVTFCDRRWISLEQSDYNFGKMNADNVFVDEEGHLHLCFSLHDDVWKGAGVRLSDALGFGRYEFDIEGLDRLDRKVGFSLYSQVEHEPGIGINVTVAEGEVPDGRYGLRFSLRRPDYGTPRPRTADTAHSYTVTRMYTRTTHSYNWKPDSVLFRSLYGHQPNGRAHGLGSWSNDSRPNIPQKAMPVFICLSNSTGFAPSDGRDVEIIVHSFRFYPDQG